MTDAATLAWDAELVVRGAAGACQAVFGRSAADLRGRTLAELFDRPESLADALTFGTARQIRLATGQTVRLEAGPCPGGAVCIARRSSADELDLGRLVSALGHELRNAFAAVLLAVQSLGKHGEVTGERGRRRLQVAERELRRIECVLRGLQEVGRTPVLRPVEVVPERLIHDALQSLAPELENDRVEVLVPDAEGEPAFVDAPRVRLALEEMIRHGTRTVASGGTIATSVERRAGELALVVDETVAGTLPSNPAESSGRETDLGLAVVKGVARAHGGHVEIDREETRCRLVLVLPQRAGRK